MQWGTSLFLMLLYALVALLFWRVHQGRLKLLGALGALVAAVQIHGWLLYFSLRQEAVWDLSIFNMISLYAWTVAAVSLFWLRRSEMALAGVIICLFNAPLVLMPVLFVSQKIFTHDLSQGMIAHIVSSLAAWTLLFLALIHALLYQFLFRRLKQKQLQAQGQTLSLMGVERSMVLLSWLGFLFLSLSLMTGWAYVDDLWAQHLVHKSVLTCLAWLALALLLPAHHYRYWRGMRFVYALFAIFALLLLGYGISNIVLQFLVRS